VYLYLKRLKLLFSIGLIFSMRYRSDDYDSLRQHIYDLQVAFACAGSALKHLYCQRFCWEGIRGGERLAAGQFKPRS